MLTLVIVESFHLISNIEAGSTSIPDVRTRRARFSCSLEFTRRQSSRNALSPKLLICRSFLRFA